MGDKPKKVETYLDLTDKTHAYLFGYLWADGNISKTGYRISASSCENDIIDILKIIFGGVSSYRKRVQKETGTIKNVYEWRLDRKLFNDDIKSKGFRNSIDCIPLNSIPSFLLGYLDGDGCIYHKDKYFQVTFTSKKDEDWTWFNKAVNKINGPKFNISKRSSWCRLLNKTTNSSIARITSNPALKFLDILYSQHNGLYLERKYKKYFGYKTRQNELHHAKV